METVDFSFAGGGAIISQLRKFGIIGENKPTLLVRILSLVLITWLPLLILTAFAGLALTGRVKVPFLYDLTQYARFLVALPIMIWAEPFVSPRFKSVLNRFLTAELISGTEVPYFKEAISKANSLKNSVVAEVLIIILIYIYMSLGLERSLSPGLTSWIRSRTDQTDPKILAEYWYVWISMPVFLFIGFRWVWRLAIWATLLWRISKLKLQLISTHPDSAGGLAFISVGQRRFAALIFATSCIASASIGEEILFGGAKLQMYELELLTFFIVSVSIVMGPLMVFSPQLIRAKLRDWGKYGILAGNYSKEFDEKWIRGKNPSNEKLLGSSDIQSLADMKNSYEGVSRMRTVLPDQKTIIILFIAYVAPLLPLLATIIPLTRILSELFKLLSG